MFFLANVNYNLHHHVNSFHFCLNNVTEFLFTKLSTVNKKISRQNTLSVGSMHALILSIFAVRFMQ